MELPQNRRLYGKMECFSLWLSYIGEKGRTLGKTYGIKVRCYWENPWGTHWELREDIGNPLGKFSEILNMWKIPTFYEENGQQWEYFPKEITRLILTKDIGMNIKTLTKHKGMPFTSQTCFWG
jgi:hypothetical protein